MGKFDKRIDFLIDKFDVYMDSEVDDVISDLEKSDYIVNLIGSEKKPSDLGDNIAIVYYHDNVDGNITKKSMVNENIFSKMLKSDPTDNKMYLQWMLTVFSKLLNNGKNTDAIMFATEDLSIAKEYLQIFHKNKRKKLFSELSKNNYALKGLKDPTNINQYNNLSQLFDAVDPYIDKDSSNLDRIMGKFVDAGQATIPVKDRRFTLYIPLTTEASVIFDKFSGWCTAKSGNGMFNNYTNNKTPLSNKSNIFIIIDNRFLNGDFDDDDLPDNSLCQIHFETKQIMDRKNKRYNSIYDDFISKSVALSNYFYEKLKPLAKAFDGSLKNNYYVDYLIDFGFSDILFDLVDDNSPSIMFREGFIPKVPDISRFKNLEYLLLGDVQLESLNDSIFDLPKLTILSVPNNKLTELPKSIGYSNNLVFMNILNNKITKIPDEISKLDKSNGGKLHRMSVRSSDIGTDNFAKLKKLLPSVIITEDI